MGELDGSKVGSRVGKEEGCKIFVGFTDGITEGEKALFVVIVTVDISFTSDDDINDKDWS